MGDLVTVIEVLRPSFSKTLSRCWVVRQVIWPNFGFRRGMLLNPMPGVEPNTIQIDNTKNYPQAFFSFQVYTCVALLFFCPYH